MLLVVFLKLRDELERQGEEGGTADEVTNRGAQVTKANGP